MAKVLNITDANTNEQEFAASCETVRTKLTHGIRVLNTSLNDMTVAYSAVLNAVIVATRNVDDTPSNLHTYTNMVRFHIERDLYQLCTSALEKKSLASWTTCVNNAIFVQEGYAACLYPYNQAMTRFQTPHGHTDVMTTEWVQRFLDSHEHALNKCVHEVFQQYSQERIQYVTTGANEFHTIKLSGARNQLKQWIKAINAYCTNEQSNDKEYPFYAKQLPTLLPVIQAHFDHHAPLPQKLWSLSRCYEVEIEHHLMSQSQEMSHNDAQRAIRICTRRLLHWFDIERAWHSVQTRLSSEQPIIGEASFFYDEALLQAFIDFDETTIRKYTRAFTTVPFRHASRFDEASTIHLLYLYAAASIRYTQQPLTSKSIRRLWKFVHKFLSDMFTTNHTNENAMQMKNIQKLEKLYLGSIVLSQIRNTCAQDRELHVLLPLLIEMMEPDNVLSTLEWTLDNEWWIHLFAAAKDKDVLIFEYLEHSLKPRLITKEYVIDYEIELMVSMSVFFGQGHCRALQQFRLLLAPCSISPEFQQTTSVYLAPQLVWKELKQNDVPNTKLHPIVNQPMEDTATEYTRDYFSERRVRWSPWYSMATLQMKNEDSEACSLTAPVFAISVVATIAESEDGLTQADILSQHAISSADVCCQQESSLEFVLQFLEHHNVVHVTEDEATKLDVYRLNEWSQELTLPVMDVPYWEKKLVQDVSGLQPGLSEGAQHALLITEKERLEALSTNCLKHSDEPIEQRVLEAYVCNLVQSYKPVSTKHVGLVVDGLVDKGYIVRVDETHLAYAQDDENIM